MYFCVKFYSLLDKFRGKGSSHYTEFCISGNTGENNDRPFTIATNWTGPRRCATRVAAFVLIVRRMIHGALWYGDHPRNILSSRYQSQAPELIPAVEAEGHWKLVLARYGKWRALCSPVKYTANSGKNKVMPPGNPEDEYVNSSYC